MNLVT